MNMFADDAKLMRVIKNTVVDCHAEELQGDIDKIIDDEWSNTWITGFQCKEKS